jgi:hypothetical protein
MNCKRCQDRGYLGGALNGPYAGPWRWCSCPAALEAQNSEPDLIEKSNAARDKLLGKFPAPQLKQLVPVTDDYHGEF